MRVTHGLTVHDIGGRLAVPFLLAVLLLSVFTAVRAVVATPSFEIGDNATAQGFDPAAGLPTNRTQNFKSTDIVVVSWVKFTNVYSPSHSVNWVWRTPQGFAYWKPNGTISDPGAGRYWLSYYFYWYTAVRGYSAALIPGTWHIDIYVDGTLALEQNFTMTSQTTPVQTPWANIGPKNIANDISGSCYTTGYLLPCSSYVSAGKVAAFAYDPATPSILYISCDGGASAGAGCAQGIFKSTDSGSTWQTIDNGFTGSSARGLAVKKGSPSIVVALTDFAVFKTTDGGADWVQTYNGAGFKGVGLYQTDNDTLYRSLLKTEFVS